MTPRFSVLTPVYNTDPTFLRQAIASVTGQTFADWELILADDGSTSTKTLAVLAGSDTADPRVRVIHRAENGGIVAATNTALEAATGEFIALLDHDDELHPDALGLVDKAIDIDETVDFVYTDEDRMEVDGRRWGGFHKPDWAPDTLRSQMYTSHLSAFRRQMVVDLGGYRADFEGSQDYDLTLRVAEVARRVEHVPEICYHWRSAPGSVAENPDSKPYAYVNATRALNDHLQRSAIPAVAADDAEHLGVHHLEPQLTEQPLVSVIIPTIGTRRTVQGLDQPLVVSTLR